MEDPRRFRRLVYVVASIALITRFAVLVAFWPTWMWQSGQVQDDWNKLAINWVDSGTFGFSPGEPTIQRGPIFPLFEIPLYLMFGENYAAWSIALLLFDTATLVLLMLLARRLWGNRAAFFAALFYAVYLPIIYYTALISQFTTVLPFVVLWLYLISSWDVRASSRPHYVALGVISGILILNKIVYLPVVVGSAAVLIWLNRRQADVKRVVRNAAVMLLIAVVVVGPWTYRNYVVTNGKFIPVQALFWELVWQRSVMLQLDAREGWNRPSGRTLEYFLERQNDLMRSHAEPAPAHLTGPQKELYREKIFRLQTIEWLRTTPSAYARNVLNNVWYFWLGAENLRKTFLMAVMQIPLLGAALLGLWFAVRHRQVHKLRMGLVLILILWVEHSVVFGWGRFSLDTVPALAVIFGTGIDARLRHRK